MEVEIDSGPCVPVVLGEACSPAARPGIWGHEVEMLAKVWRYVLAGIVLLKVKDGMER